MSPCRRARKPFVLFTVAVLLCALVPARAEVDARFGLVGTGGRAFAAKFGLKYYTLEGNYSEGKGDVFSSVDPANDPAAGFSVVREAAKLNMRTDGLGQTNAQFQAKLTQYVKDLAAWYILPSYLRGTKPAFSWYSPNAAALVAAESLQIVQTLRREKANGVTGTVWEIGNEPNLFPAITPAEYGALFAAYRRVIKGEDPAAVVAMGSLFLPEPAGDLKARVGEELDTRIRAEISASGVPLTSGSISSLVNDVKNTLFSRVLALPAKEWLRQAIVAAAARPDIVSLHAYPYDDRAPFLDSAAERTVLDTTFAGIDAMLAALGTSAPGPAAWPPPLWITEFGNIQQGLAEDQVAALTRRLTAAFAGHASVGGWFQYKATGNDEQFALFSSGAPPLTRLAVDPAFSPADGNFSCSKLNAVGRAYWRASHGGGECGDPNVPPVLDSLASDRSSLSEGDSVRVRAWATDADGGSLTYTWIRRNGDTLGSGAEATYRAGYRDAGPDTLRVTVRDGQGGSATRTLFLSISNTALRPAILNAEGSTLAAAGALAWGWEGAADPDLAAEGLLARVEIHRDTAAGPIQRIDSLAAKEWTPSLSVAPGAIYARVLLFDAAGHTTPWSAWRRLEAASPPVGLRPAVRAPRRPVPGVDFDWRGRALPNSARRSQL